MPPRLTSAKALDKSTIQLEFEYDVGQIEARDITVRELDIHGLQVKESQVEVKTSELDIRRNYIVHVAERGRIPLDMGALLDPLYSEKPLGCVEDNGDTIFRLFAPRAHSVKLVIFERHKDETGTHHQMSRDQDGVWEIALPGAYAGKYYGYRVSGPRDRFECFSPRTTIADPYSRAVASRNSYLHESKSIILDRHDYDWQGDDFVSRAAQDLTIYEMHVRDMTMHPSAQAEARGTYPGLLEQGTKGGLNHVRELGVNAVELLPCQAFGKIEIPFEVKVGEEMNTWNPYARNYWGYMTSYFFAPEAYYASGGNLKPNQYIGVEGQQVNEFKDMVKALHQAGLTVILDVVYNHVSHYDLNPLKYTDKQYYFRLNSRLRFVDGATGCGNELKSERRMARRLIIDSIRHWMQDYHIDGFRFDLAPVLDWETIEQIRDEARKINPDVILIAEPWSLISYEPGGFSDRDWMSWNDQFRNGIKGENPFDGHGLIFGTHYHGNDRGAIERLVRGSVRDYHGPFVKPDHSVNYLESHDGYTLGDFIRLGTGEASPDEPVADVDAHAKLSVVQMQLNKLAAVLLLTSQGATMLHAGQEWARSKVIAPTEVDDPEVGHLDHNSYNKDNETNWLNFEHKELNQELVDYYKGLIRLRAKHVAFRRTPPDRVHFLATQVQYVLAYWLKQKDSGDAFDFIVMVNANPEAGAAFELPQGRWLKVVDAKRAGTEVLGNAMQGRIELRPRTALVLRSA